MLGWEGGGVRLVFTGTVDEVRSSGSRSGRTISVSAKGIDTKSKVKEPQQKHYDKKTVKDVLTEAGKVAGITSVEIDPDLGKIEREYFEQRDESFIHFGERLAREIGGNFRIQGKTATMSKRMGAYTSFVMARWGENLHSWDISPALGRPAFKKARARWYDRKEAKWKEQEVEVQLDADAETVARYSEPDEQQSKDRAGSDKATSERDVAEGSVTIEGDTGAIPDGLCILSGTRAGIDGAYRIESVDHEYSRSGFTTKLELKSAGAE
jgi:phage protein D